MVRARRVSPFDLFDTDKYVEYFEERGGRRGVKDTDSVWIPLYKHLNEKNKNVRGYKKLTGACSQCRARAYKMIHES